MVIANILQPLIDAAGGVLGFFHDELGWSWGFGIVALTVAVRILILPFTYHQIRSLRHIKAVQPHIKAIQQHYKDDPEKMKVAMFNLYVDHKANPMGFIWPILIQAPFFAALFFLLNGKAFQQTITGEEQFLFIPDLAEKLSNSVPVMLMMVGIYIATQVIAGLIATEQVSRTSLLLQLGVPVLVVVILVNFPAGLMVYWITVNLWMILQQATIRWVLPKEILGDWIPPEEEAGANSDSHTETPPTQRGDNSA